IVTLGSRVFVEGLPNNNRRSGSVVRPSFIWFTFSDAIGVPIEEQPAIASANNTATKAIFTLIGRSASLMKQGLLLEVIVKHECVCYCDRLTNCGGSQRLARARAINAAARRYPAGFVRRRCDKISEPGFVRSRSDVDSPPRCGLHRRR